MLYIETIPCSLYVFPKQHTIRRPKEYMCNALRYLPNRLVIFIFKVYSTNQKGRCILYTCYPHILVSRPSYFEQSILYQIFLSFSVQGKYN